MRNGDQTIGLCMIVRNEAANVERCLESLTGLIDSWVICDTGSVDRTCEIVRAALAELPGELHRTEWQDFGHNRSELMELATGTADYLLMLDADMTVKRRASLPALDADAYTLPEEGGSSAGVPRLVRGDRRWWYEGPTHDHIATDGRVTERRLDALVIEHHGDARSPREKLLRDLGLLKRQLARTPDSPRTLFQLAETCRHLGRHETAMRYYRRRAKLGGWEEELLQANLQLGALGAIWGLDEAISVLHAAWLRWPDRAEPLYELARAHRRRGDLATAHMFATRGLEIPPPANQVPIQPWVYSWGIRLERARAASGLGRLQQARADLRGLLQVPSLPEPVEDYARGILAGLRGSGAGPQARPVRLDSLAAGVRIGELRLETRPQWPSFNPSIARDANGFRMIVRTANYQIEQGVLHRDGILHNLNYLVSLDDDLAVTEVEPLIDRSLAPRLRPAQICGYEDCRLIEVNGDWYATATACDLNPVARREMVLLHLDGSRITAAQRLEGPFPGRHEKNWMPFVTDGSLHALYTCGPTTVLRCNPATADVEVVTTSPAPQIAEGFRGGSQGIRVDGGHLFAVHEVDRRQPALRYLHRFVLLGEDLALTAMSPPFSFTLDRVEFCAGMARAGDELVMSFGVSDAAAGLVTLPLDEALSLLEPIRAPRTSRRHHGFRAATLSDRSTQSVRWEVPAAAAGVALSAAMVWTSPFPFADAAVGQKIPSGQAVPANLVLTAGLNRYIADLSGQPPEPPCTLGALSGILGAVR